MIVSHEAYWTSPAGEQVLPTGADKPKSVVVTIPKQRMFTVERLTAPVPPRQKFDG